MAGTPIAISENNIPPEVPHLEGGIDSLGPIVGEGGSAAVHKASHNGRTVAVKVYGRIAQNSFANFVKAVMTMYIICHPSFPEFIGWCFLEDSEGASANPCAVMEHISGPTLYHCLLDGSMAKLSWKTVQGLLHDFTDGLVYLHDNLGMVHGDLHPCNLMLSTESAERFKELRGKICDVDNARSCEDVNFIPRDNYWLAPETWFGQYTSKSDVFSYGIIMWSLITRKLPPMHAFGGTSVLDVGAMRSKLNKKRSLGARIMKLLRGGPTKSLIDLVETCLAEQPQDRPTMNEILNVIKAKTQF